MSNLVLLLFLLCTCDGLTHDTPAGPPGQLYLHHAQTQNDDDGTVHYFEEYGNLGELGEISEISSHNHNNHISSSRDPTSVGLSPPVLNLAVNAAITVNATCGESRAETYCKLVEHVHLRSRPESQCDVCDARSHDRNKRHPIEYATDGSSRWWQSPSLQSGREFEWVTITINLRQVYQVAYIVIKAANSPRPGNWILERSLDGVTYEAWQYFAVSNEECWSKYGLQGTSEKPSFATDDEVICTSYYSKITPFEGGEIHTSLVNGRPGAAGPSETLIKFTMAQFIRLRFQKIRTLLADLVHGGGDVWDRTVMRRYFYSIKDISIGGHCVCFGHSNECIADPTVQNSEKCMCKHNTCGLRCDSCCPMFNQHRWAVGNSTSAAMCEPCQCHGHADACVFDEAVAAARKSVNVHGIYDGGGVCVGCQHFTTGINCEKCVAGYYRPAHVPAGDPNPCRKCDCDPTGSVGANGGEAGACFTDQSPTTAATANLKYGDCICKPGFSGRRCDQCAEGYRNFPRCEACPCNMAGVIDDGCDGQCICKPNVQGRTCTDCKPGFYNLDGSNPNGSTQCFCNGLTDQCTSSNSSVIRVENGDDGSWFVSDFAATRVIPVQRSGGLWHVSNEEFAGVPAGVYFWCANGSWTGYHLDSYGLRLVVHVSWVQARGDTSGRVLQEYDVIVRGLGRMLAFSGTPTHSYEGNNATIGVRLNEIQCQVLPDPPDPPSRHLLHGGDARPCTRHDVMHVLHDIRLVLLRAKYRTDQLEGLLLEAYLEKASGVIDEYGSHIASASSVEQCTCPPGYMGPSCETCAYGYRSSTTDTWLTRCYPCECNGHAKSCDLDGTCSQCEHNTEGAYCETCKPGFYGRASARGDTNACKPCECPLGPGSGNNFSATCELDGNNYRCNACEEGYEGDFCERCANGWWGNPTKVGDRCKRCECNKGAVVTSAPKGTHNQPICDHLTGECFVCSDNAGGWKCEECLPGFYGSPVNGTCQPCACNKYGSIGGDCHPETGHCICADNFEGPKCDRCVTGHGSLEDDCPACTCDERGSESGVCDPATGACSCKPGVGGRFCNRCLDHHYNFTHAGCTSCECNEDGSDSPICDVVTGQCSCLPHVQGRKCDSCESGWWGIESGLGCTARCECHVEGTIDSVTCDPSTGQCPCKSGVGGRCCDECAEGYWGFSTGASAQGCRPCDPCTKPGHICDRATGHCSCLRNTEGDECDKCVIGTWGYSPTAGCQECGCAQHGSISQQCSLVTGKCSCREGFDGEKCDTCKFGYYGYPKCLPCSCDGSGTIESYCDDEAGLCGCDATGQCQCKENVVGQKCNRCSEGTYDLRKSNPEGCQECFCFRRTNKCSQGLFQWERFGMLNSRSLTTIPSNRSHSHAQTQSGQPPRLFNPYNEGEEQCFIYLALPSERRIEPLWNSKFRLKLVNNLIVIPDSGNDVMLENEISFGAPLYWPLPHIFTGDKVLSYGGYLRFRVTSEGGGSVFPYQVLESYPLVQIQGNYRLILEHFVQRENPTGYYEIKLHEDYWQLKNFNRAGGGGGEARDGAVTKEVMMVALQNLQSILIRGTSRPEIHSARLFNVSLDIAIPTNGTRPNGLAFGIEICDCPPEYNSTSCQNPKLGYYRWYKNEYITSTVIIDLIGEAKPCDCNGRSDVCDTETGNCLACAANTGGPHCDECATGHYGHPVSGCQPCPCPTVWTNHATSCKPLIVPAAAAAASRGQTPFQCRCRTGYTGRLCEKCEFGYFGNATVGTCQPCTCNEYGSIGKECDPFTGQCACRPEITGRDCTKCSQRHVLIGRVCTSCVDQCTGVLLQTVDNVASELRQGIHILLDGYGGDSTGLVANVSTAAVWAKVAWIESQCEELTTALTALNSASGVAGGPTGSLVTRIHGFETLYRGLTPLVTQYCNRTEFQREELTSTLERVIALGTVIEIASSTTREAITLLEKYAQGHFKGPTTPNATVEREMGELVDQMRSATAAFVPILDEMRRENAEATAVLQEVQNYVWTFDDFREDIEKTRDKLDDIRHYASEGQNSQAQADGVLYTAHEHLRGLQSNIEAIQRELDGLHITGAGSDHLLSRGDNMVQEINQVMMMIEDLLVNSRNWTKEVEIRSNDLFDIVPLYRVRFAQPAFDHVKFLQQKSAMLQGLIHAATFNGSERLQGLDNMRSIARLVNEADELTKSAGRVNEDTRSYMTRYLDMVELQGVASDSEGRIRDGELLQEIVARAMQNNYDVSQAAVDNSERNLASVRASLSNLDAEISRLDGTIMTDERYNELLEPITTTKRLMDEIAMNAMQIESELKSRIAGTPISDAVHLDNVRTIEEELKLKLSLLEVKWEEVRVRYEAMKARHEAGTGDLEYLKALILQARHRADSVPVSLGPDESGICFRLFRVASLAVSTSIRFKYAPIRSSDSLLFYWPSSFNEDFISIEMVALKIKVSWNLGSGLHTVIYPKKLVPDLESDTQSPGSSTWVDISLERIGSSFTVRVDNVETPGGSDPVSYQGADEESTLLDLTPNDFVHIGGFSKEKRPGLVSNGLSGCIHNLQINGRVIGLWNFVGNEGCAPCIECPGQETTGLIDLDYYADGRASYSAVSRVQSQTFNPNAIEIAIEFQTHAANGLLFLTVNDQIGQCVCLELVGGQLKFSVQHAWSGNPDPETVAAISVETNNTALNSGKWIQLHAIWVFQFGAQTVQLTVGKSQRYTQTKSSNSKPLALQLLNAQYNIAGLSPTFRSKASSIPAWANLREKESYRGCLKNILIDGTTYDLVAGQHHGIESGCKGRNTYTMSFVGNGFAEYQTPQLQLLDGKDVHFGFSFRTTYPSGILMMVTLAQDASTSTSVGPALGSAEISIQPWLMIYLENGSIFVQIGTLADSMIIGNQTVDGSNELDIVDGHRCDDGLMHAFRMSRRNRKIKIYMDDELVQEDRMPKKNGGANGAGSGSASGRHRLFFGGINLEREQYLVVETQIPKNRFHGCIEYFFFGQELLPFNDPVTSQNHVVGPCSAVSDSNGGAVHSYDRLTLTTIDGLGVGVGVGRRRPAGDLLRSLDGDEDDEDRCSPYDEDGVQFGGQASNATATATAEESYGAITLQANALKQKFNLTFSFLTREHAPNAVQVLAYGVSKKQHHEHTSASCILIYLNNGILNMKLYGNRPQELICSTPTVLNDGNWHQVSVIKSENKIYIFMDAQFQTKCEYLTTKIKSIHKLYIGGVPRTLQEESSNCLGALTKEQDQEEEELETEEGDYDPDGNGEVDFEPDPSYSDAFSFTGCMRGIVINSFQYSFRSPTVTLHGVRPCTSDESATATSRNLVLNASNSEAAAASSPRTSSC